MELLLHDVCARLGRSLGEFAALPGDEQEAWLAWGWQRHRAREKAIQNVFEWAKDDDGKIGVEKAHMLATVALLRMD